MNHDRPKQALRSFRRMVSEDDTEILSERLVVWSGPLPFDIGTEPGELWIDWKRPACPGQLLAELLKLRVGRPRLATIMVERSRAATSRGEPPTALQQAQRAQELAMELQGPYAQIMHGTSQAINDGAWQFSFLRSRASTIAGGTAEIQRNIIAERVLGLPKG